MKQTNEKVYRCDHCNKAMISKGFMSYHEKWCKRNPNNMHKCFEWCEHLKRTRIEITEADEDQNTEHEYVFICNVTKKEMYSYKLEKKLTNRQDELKKRIQDLIRMPLECEYYKDMDEYEEDETLN